MLLLDGSELRLRGVCLGLARGDMFDELIHVELQHCDALLRQAILPAEERAQRLHRRRSGFFSLQCYRTYSDTSFKHIK